MLPGPVFTDTPYSKSHLSPELSWRTRWSALHVPAGLLLSSHF